MKTKFKFLLVVILLSVNISNINSQNRSRSKFKSKYEPDVSVDISSSFLNFNTKSSSPLTFGYGLSVCNIYITFASNYQKNSLDYNKNKNKVLTSIFNIGYNITYNKHIILTPILGYAYSKDLYIDQKRSYTNYICQHKINIGLDIIYKHNNIGLILGTSSVENFKIGLIMFKY